MLLLPWGDMMYGKPLEGSGERRADRVRGACGLARDVLAPLLTWARCSEKPVWVCPAPLWGMRLYGKAVGHKPPTSGIACMASILACIQTFLNLLPHPHGFTWSYIALLFQMHYKSEILRVWHFISANQMVTEIMFQFVNIFVPK